MKTNRESAWPGGKKKKKKKEGELDLGADILTEDLLVPIKPIMKEMEERGKRREKKKEPRTSANLQSYQLILA